MKVLLFNLGYCSGLDGSFRDYALHGLRYLHTPERIIADIEDSVFQLLHQEEPDICCFLELHKKSALVKDMRGYACSDIDVKYGLKSLLRFLPFFRDNCNGFYAKESIPYKKFYFKKGAKKLIYELEMENDVSLLFCHFSLSRSVRKKQFKQLEAMIRSRKKLILCGDFNIFKGTGEIEALMSTCNLHAANLRQSTFPSVNPQKAFDQFLCTEDIHITRCEAVRDFQGSDHLPVLMEFQV